MTDREQRIRDIAYFLWLEEGSPEGRSERHWLEAEGLVDSEPEEEARVEGELPAELKKEPSSIAAAGSD
jgi:Protein of unknown function (DUF2934)